MKWIKTAIGAVIAISVVPLVVLNFFNIGKSLESEEIIFAKEVMNPTDTGVYYLYPFTTPTSDNDIYEFIVNNDIEDYNITLSLSFDTEVINITILEYYFLAGEVVQFIDNNSLEYRFSSIAVRITNTYDSIYSVNAENLTSINVIFYKPSNVKHSNIISMIISLAPLIFIGGVLFYFYKPFKRND